MFRLIRDVRPAWTIIENVSALRSKGLTLVLQNLSSIGYMSEWHCIPAAAIGANHQRDRIWIVAHPYSKRDESCIREEISRWENEEISDTKFTSRSERGDSLFSKVSTEKLGDTDSKQFNGMLNGSSSKGSKETSPSGEIHSSDTGSNRSTDMADSNNAGSRTSECGDMSEDRTKVHEGQEEHTQSGSSGCSTEVANSNSKRCGGGSGEGCADGERKLLQGEQEGGEVGSKTQGRSELLLFGNTTSGVPRRSPWWQVEPNVGRVAHGVPKRVDSLKCLGNAVVPQIPQLIGYQILEFEERNEN